MKMIAFSDRIKEYMTVYNLNQGDMANRLGMSKQGISTWATGRTTPNFGDVPEIAKKLGISVAWLMGVPNVPMIDKSLDEIAEAKAKDQMTMDEAPKVELNGAMYPVYTEEQLDKRLQMIARAMDMFDQGKIDMKMLELIVNSMR